MDIPHRNIKTGLAVVNVACEDECLVIVSLIAKVLELVMVKEDEVSCLAAVILELELTA